MDSIHFSFSLTVESGSDLITEMFVEITVRGVFNSWDAFAVNSFCFSKASDIGLRAFFVKKKANIPIIKTRTNKINTIDLTF